MGEQGSFLNNSAHLQTQSPAKSVLGSQYFRAVFTQRGQLYSNQNLMGHPRGGSLEAEKECSLIRNARIRFSPSQQATRDCGLFGIIEEILCQQLPGKEAWSWQDTGPGSPSPVMRGINGHIDATFGAHPGKSPRGLLPGETDAR